MKFSYKFSNLLGTVYKTGDLLFSPDGNSVISPVGNKISVFDLKNNKASTLPIESRFNFTALDLSPNGRFLLAIEETGKAYYISMVTQTILHTYHFKRKITRIKFSPDGKYFAICKESLVFIYKAPNYAVGELNPFELVRCIRGAYDDTSCIDWTSDSKVIAIGAKDMITRLYGIDRLANFGIQSLGSHRDSIVACFFEDNSLDITTIGRNGHVSVWECNIELSDLKPWVDSENFEVESDDEKPDDVDERHAERTTDEQEKIDKRKEVEVVEEEEQGAATVINYKRASKHYLKDLLRESPKAMLISAAYHKGTHLLVTGFSNGAFFLHEMPDVNLIHSLSISEQSISSLAINNTGDWIGIGCSSLGQLVVWEWQSETYVMKQQGHYNNMYCLDYSPDGQFIATGGGDGKVKIWNTMTGFCVVTFNEHTSAVTGVQFSNNRKVIISSSLDGTVRAFDMIRYRNFRTFTSPRPAQFSCVAMDTTAEFVAAGGQDVFEIYLWSMKIGRLLEVLSGHEGPVISVAFSPSPTSTTLASVSWDKTLKIWNTIEVGSDHESVLLASAALCVSFRPDGEEIAVATLDGQISFFETKYANQTGNIEGRNDLGAGRSDTDLVTAKSNLKGKAFTSLCYTADGECILAGGQSKNVCIYHVAEGLLMKKFEVTQNRSLDSVDDFVNRRNMSEFGNMMLIERREGGDVAIKLPGARKGDMAARSFKPEVRIYGLHFSPTGTAWAAVTTEGLLIYSLDQGMMFDPFFLDESITPESMKKILKEKEWSKALMMATKLNEKPLIQEVLETIPASDIEMTARTMPIVYAERVLKFAGLVLENTRHLEFYLLWVEHLLTSHGQHLRQTSAQSMPLLLTIEKSVNRRHEDLSKLCDFNKYTQEYILRQAKMHQKKLEEENEVEMERVDKDDEMSVDE
ncbi:periodic tryptophan protein 2 homolog [Neocloeon triangulifer]|uniref:periodic tryptophan protein 2 homolog n=1 Tax=Neocloeon triangulifer TaxID=2078957 RepID=UPI00286EBCAF|nr:periodic tryptophan protein 2 homolog [Neocloeon triangulifer]